MTLKVRFNELDPYNHVNHAVYISYFEAARVEALTEIDLALESLADKGIQLVITEVNAKYREAATAGDVLTIDTWLSKAGRASSVWSQQIRRGDTILVTADVRAAITNLEGKVIRPPAWLTEQLQQLAVAPD